MKWVLSVSSGFYRGAIGMQCYNDLPKVTSMLMELNPGNLAPESSLPHPNLYKLDFPENADQGFRTEHKTLEGPRKFQREPLSSSSWNHLISGKALRGHRTSHRVLQVLFQFSGWSKLYDFGGLI